MFNRKVSSVFNEWVNVILNGRAYSLFLVFTAGGSTAHTMFLRGSTLCLMGRLTSCLKVHKREKFFVFDFELFIIL